MPGTAFSVYPMISANPDQRLLLQNEKQITTLVFLIYFKPKTSIMNTKKLIIGTIVGGIVYFLLGWLLYGMLLLDYFNKHQGIIKNTMRVQPIFLYLVIGNLVMALMLTYIFVKSKSNTAGSGFIMGGVIGFLSACGYDFVSYATTMITSRQAIIADVIIFTVMSAITGAIINLVSPKTL